MAKSLDRADMPELFAANRHVAPTVNPLYAEIASSGGTASYEYVLRRSRELRRSYDARTSENAGIPQRRSLALNPSHSSRSLILSLPGGTAALALTEEAIREANVMRKRDSMSATARGSTAVGSTATGLLGDGSEGTGFDGFDATVTQLSPDAHAAVVTALLSASDVHQLRALGFDLDGNGYLWLPAGVGSSPDARVMQTLGVGERMVLQTLAATYRQRVHIPSFLRAQQTEFSRMARPQEQAAVGAAGSGRDTERDRDALVHVQNPMRAGSRSSPARPPAAGTGGGEIDLSDVVDFYAIEQALCHAMSYGKMITIAGIVKVVIALLRLFSRDTTAFVGFLGVLGVYGASSCNLGAVWLYGGYCMATSILCAHAGALLAMQGADADLGLVTSARGNSAVGTLVGTGVFALIGLYGCVGYHSSVHVLYDCGWETTPWTQWLLQHVVKSAKAAVWRTFMTAVRVLSCGLLVASPASLHGDDGSSQSLQGSILLSGGRRGGLGVEVMGSPRIVRVIIQNRRQAYVSRRAAERRWEYLRGQALTAEEYGRRGNLQQVQVRAHHVATALTDPLPALPSAGSSTRPLSLSAGRSAVHADAPPLAVAVAASPSRAGNSSARLLHTSQQSPTSRVSVPASLPPTPSSAPVLSSGTSERSVGFVHTQQQQRQASEDPSEQAQDAEEDNISAPVYAARARTRPLSTASVSTGSSPVSGIEARATSAAVPDGGAVRVGVGAGAGAGSTGASTGGRLSRDGRGTRPTSGTMPSSEGVGLPGGARHTTWSASRPAELVASISTGVSHHARAHAPGGEGGSSSHSTTSASRHSREARSRSPASSAAPAQSRTTSGGSKDGHGRPTVGQDALEGSAATGLGVSIFGAF